MTKQEESDQIKLVQDKIVSLLTDAGMEVDKSTFHSDYLKVDGVPVNVQVHYCVTRLQVHISDCGLYKRLHKIYPRKNNGTFNWDGIVDMIKSCVKQQKQDKISADARRAEEVRQVEIAKDLMIQRYQLERSYGKYILKVPMSEKTLFAVMNLIREMEGK